MTFKVAVAPKLVAEHESIARFSVEDGKILADDEVLDKALILLFLQIAARFGANLATLAGGAVAVNDLYRRAAPAFAVSQVIGNALDGVVCCGQIAFDIYFLEITAHGRSLFGKGAGAWAAPALCLFYFML